MPPAYRSSTYAGSSSTAAQSVNVPAGAQTGDLLVAHFNLGFGCNPTLVGWALRMDVQDPVMGSHGAVMTKEYAGESGPYIFVIAPAGLCYVAVSAYSQAAYGAINGQYVRNSGQSTAPSVNVPVADSLLAHLHGNVDARAYDPPVGMTEMYDAPHINGYTVAGSYQVPVGAGATGDKAGNLSGSANQVNFLVALSPTSTPPKPAGGRTLMGVG